MFYFYISVSHSRCFSLIILLVFELFSEHFTHTGYRGANISRREKILWMGKAVEWDWGLMALGGVQSDRKGVSKRCARFWRVQRFSKLVVGPMRANVMGLGLQQIWDLRGMVHFLLLEMGLILANFEFPSFQTFWSVSVLFRCSRCFACGGFKVWGVPSLFVCWCLEQGWALGNWRSDGAVFAIFNSQI